MKYIYSLHKGFRFSVVNILRCDVISLLENQREVGWSANINKATYMDVGEKESAHVKCHHNTSEHNWFSPSTEHWDIHFNSWVVNTFQPPINSSKFSIVCRLEAFISAVEFFFLFCCKLYFQEMAGNFWQSSHYQQWLLTKDDLLRDRRHDLQFLNPEEYQKLNIFFANLIQVLGEQLKLRQQVIATATVYFKRYYVRNSFRSIDPLLMAPTCIFLASKVEEFGVISNSRLISTVCTTFFAISMIFFDF